MKNQEHHIQVQIVTYLRFNKIFCWATPNGGYRGGKSEKGVDIAKIIGKKLKLEGVMAGVSDLTALIDVKTYYIEVKTKTGRQTDTQKVFQKMVESHGHIYLIWRSLEDAIDFVNLVKKKRYKIT